MTIYQYRLASLNNLTDDIVMLGFTPIPHSPVMSYISGQYIEVLTDTGIFPLSIANTPSQKNQHAEIIIHLRSGALHPVADAFLTNVKQQGRISFIGPKGHCIPKLADSYFFVAGGTGFSPIQSLLTEILPTGKPCTLYWGIRDAKDLYQQKLIAEWQKKYSHFSYVPVLTQAQDAWQGKTGWVHEVFFQEQISKIKQLTTQHKTYYVYASGPYPLIQSLKNGFITHHFPLEYLLSDMLPSSVT